MSKSKPYFLALLFLSGAALLWGCLTSSGSGLTRTGIAQAYRVVGSKLIVTEKYFECSGSVANAEEETDTSSFSIVGNTLTSYNTPESYSSNLIIQFFVTFDRVSGSGGIQGAWQIKEFSYQKISGVMDTASKNELDREVAIDTKLFGYGTQQFVFTADSLIDYQDIETAKLFVDEWNGLLDPEYLQYSDSAEHNISVQATGKTTVVLKGLVNNETVHITLSENGDADFTSDKAGHAAYHYSEGAAPSCINNQEDSSYPVWWNAFLSANSRLSSDASAKIAAVKKKIRVKRSIFQLTHP